MSDKAMKIAGLSGVFAVAAAVTSAGSILSGHPKGLLVALAFSAVAAGAAVTAVYGVPKKPPAPSKGPQ